MFALVGQGRHKRPTERRRRRAEKTITITMRQTEDHETKQTRTRGDAEMQGTGGIIDLAGNRATQQTKNRDCKHSKQQSLGVSTTKAASATFRWLP